MRAGFAVNLVSNAAEICKNGMNGMRGCMAPTLTQLDAGSGGTYPYGRMGLFADLNLEWAPLYGKLGTLAVLPFLDMVHFNMYVALGPAFMLALFPNAFPVGANASTIALATAPCGAIVPTSPHPLVPRMLAGLGDF